MKKFKIYDTAYELEDSPSGPAEAFGYRNEFVDEVPKGARSVGYVTIDDGSVVECFQKKSILPIVISLVLLVVGGVVALFLLYQKDDIAIGGVTLKTNVDKNVITFNGIMKAEAGMCEINFVNGEYESTLEVIGEGVSVAPMTLEPGQAVPEVPITVDTEDSVVEVLIRVTSVNDVAEFNALVEIPENNNQYDTSEGVHGYFEKELIIDENQ